MLPKPSENAYHIGSLTFSTHSNKPSTQTLPIEEVIKENSSRVAHGLPLKSTMSGHFDVCRPPSVYPLAHGMIFGQNNAATAP